MTSSRRASRRYRFGGFIRETQTDPEKKSKFPDEDPCSDSEEECEYVSVPENLRGIDREQKGLLDDARRILKGEIA